MNKVEAIIRPEKLTSVKDALADAGLVAGPRGVGTVVVDMLSKVRVELVVSDQNTPSAIDAIIVNARTGDIGDGKIFVSPVTNAIRVRTGEQGDLAI